jgi:ABC-2 type transport system ATP-binding protein
VLHDVSFDVKASETFGLIGVNGAGKTTLIKTAMGLKTPLKGSVHFFGSHHDDEKVKSFFSYLPERFDPPWFLKGGEFIDFSASLYGRRYDGATLEKYCARLALDPAVLSRRVQTYSKGMRQKLGLIATVLSGSPLLILDEPMSGLDPLARALVKDLLMDVKAEGRTVILSSHILADMDEICDRVCVIHDGRQRFLGTPVELKTQMNEQSLERAFMAIIKTTSYAALAA